MGLLSLRRGRGYDRSRSLARAARARGRGRTRKAIQHYREVLEREPLDAEVHRRLAPLLAGAGQPEAAWQSYRVAAGSLARAGFLAQASGMLREAADKLGELPKVWEELAAIEVQRGRPADAHGVLVEGRRAMGSRRNEAIALLMAARRLDPHDFAANFDLAGLLARAGAAEPADRILEGLAARAGGRPLRRIRLRQLRLAPSPGRLWLWLRAWAGARPESATIPAV